MEVGHEQCCGMDAHKKMVVLAIRRRRGLYQAGCDVVASPAPFQSRRSQARSTAGRGTACTSTH